MLNMLRPHILVNCIADYYDVPGLNQQANKNISNILEHSWSASSIAATVELAFESTSDTELCIIMATNAADHMTELIHREDFTRLKLLNQFSLGVIQELFKKLMASKFELSRREGDFNRMNMVIQIHSTVSRCRHCGNFWRGFIEPDTYLVRCSECRTRHYG
jgi:Zn finger protein HypA/HybF involved in hydrogenase expression